MLYTNILLNIVVFEIFKSETVSSMKPIDQPILNEMGRFSVDDMSRYITKRIVLQIKQTPELLGMIDTLITDHFMGPVDFYDINGKPLGPTNMKKAEREWAELKFSKAMYGAAFDYFSDGNGFGWIGAPIFSMSSDQKQVLKKIDRSLADTGLSGMMNNEAMKPKKISYIAASTTEILHNEFGVYGYKQDASGKITVWDPDQIVHLELMGIDGKTRAYSSVKALAKEIALMYMIKENMIAKLSNGGSADNIISLKNNSVGTSRGRFERLRKALESFSHLKKSHGNMAIDAEVTVQSLGTSLKDMEYRELAMFTVSEFALGLGLPTSRIPFMMTGSGGTSNKGELSGNTEDAYQKKINNRRTQWELEWNPKIKSLGWMFKFRRDNMQDDVRETQAAVQRAAYVTNIQTVLLKAGKKMKDAILLEFLSGSRRNIGLDDIDDADPEIVKSAMGIKQEDNSQNNQLKDSELKSTVNKDRVESKERTANNNGVSS